MFDKGFVKNVLMFMFRIKMFVINVVCLGLVGLSFLFMMVNVGSMVLMEKVMVVKSIVVNVMNFNFDKWCWLVMG